MQSVLCFDIQKLYIFVVITEGGEDMKIKHLNEGSSMQFRLLKESVTDESSENQPLARISVDGIFHINLTARDVAEMLARKGFETPKLHG